MHIWKCHKEINLFIQILKINVLIATLHKIKSFWEDATFVMGMNKHCLNDKGQCKQERKVSTSLHTNTVEIKAFKNRE